jgi:putative nucleotidyltransferase with HDIG domain
MQIPSAMRCYQLISEMKMLEHIVDHSVQVCRVSIFLVDHMKTEKIIINRELVQASALLHDITKTRSFGTKENHVITGARFLSQRGYQEVGSIVKQHVRLKGYFFSEMPTEAEIVNYADKRVLHDTIVSLSERMNYILERYGKEPVAQKRIRWLWEKSEALEEKLFKNLPFYPDEIERLIWAEGYAEKICYPDQSFI